MGNLTNADIKANIEGGEGWFDVECVDETYLRDRFAFILSDEYFPNLFIDFVGYMPLYAYLSRNKSDWDVSLIGDDDCIYDVLCFAHQYNFKIKYIIKPTVVDRETFYGVACITEEEYKEYLLDSGSERYKVLLISSDGQTLNVNQKICTELKSHGLDYSDLFLPGNDDTNHWSFYYKSNRDDLLKLYDELGDTESRQVLVEYVDSVMHKRGYRFSTFWRSTLEKYIDSTCFNWENEEYVICLGAGIGDTFASFLLTDFPMKKMYCFEGNKERLKTAYSFIKFLDKDIQDKCEWYDTYVDEKNNCFATFRKKVTLIEMDIEGAEVIALTCLKDIIKEQRPVLAICAYHKKDDFVSIPELIKNTVDDYRFYIRKYYPNPNKMRFQKDETVLYAVPFERVIK